MTSQTIPPGLRRSARRRADLPPHQPAPLGAAAAAVPAGPPPRPAEAAEGGPARPAPGPPAPLGHVGPPAALRPRPDLQALPPPGGVVPVAGPGQGVGDLVEDPVQNLLRPVPLDQVDGQLDGLVLEETDAQRPLA